MTTKRSETANHSCLDFLKGENSKLKQENLELSQLIQQKDLEIAVFREENDNLREQLEKEKEKNADAEMNPYGHEDPDSDLNADPDPYGHEDSDSDLHADPDPYG
jgi:hypothetical protein